MDTVQRVVERLILSSPTANAAGHADRSAYALRPPAAATAKRTGVIQAVDRQLVAGAVVASPPRAAPTEGVPPNRPQPREAPPTTPPLPLDDRLSFDAAGRKHHSLHRRAARLDHPIAAHPPRDLRPYAIGGGPTRAEGVTPVEMSRIQSTLPGARGRLVAAITDFIADAMSQHAAGLLRQGITSR